jgi:hypothetical protein
VLYILEKEKAMTNEERRKLYQAGFSDSEIKRLERLYNSEGGQQSRNRKTSFSENGCHADSCVKERL